MDARYFFFSSKRRHTRYWRDWSSDVCSSDLGKPPIGTPMDRCEDIEVAGDGTVYVALTNNFLHGNFYGQVLRITESNNDPEAEEFTFEVFAAGGPQTGFASPDNLAFDRNQNLWIVTDITTDKLNDGIYETFKNNGVFVMPASKIGRAPCRERV